MVEANLAGAHVLAGRLDAAADAFAAFAGSADVAGREHAYIDALGQGALLAAWSGDLTRAADLAVRAIRLSSAVGLTPTACPGAAEVALAYVDTERYDLAGAREHAERAGRCAASRDPLPAAMLALTRARIQRAGGDVSGARRTLDDAAEGLPDWLVDQLVTRAGTATHLAVQPVDADVPTLSTRDGRTAPATKVATLPAGRDPEAPERKREHCAAGTGPGPASRGTRTVETRLPRGAGRAVAAAATSRRAAGGATHG